MRGLVLGVGAFLWWGLSPLFWKLLGHVPAEQLLFHRITWAVPVFVGAALASGEGPSLRAVARSPGTLRWMALSALFVGTNWLVYLLAVSTDRVLHASLGYFLNPLISMALGAFVLGERLATAQWAAVACAAVGVMWLTVGSGTVPWIGLVLAGSFGIYGLIRKQAPISGLAGSAVEVLWLAPFSAAGVVHAVSQSGLPDLWTATLLLVTGVVTAVPLMLFTASVRQIRLSTMGFLQYVAPTLQFVLAVAVFGEPFHPAIHGPAFGFIWAGVVVYLVGSGWREQRT